MRSELRVEVSRLGNRFLAVTRRQDGQEILSNEFRLDLSDPSEHLPLWVSGWDRPGQGRDSQRDSRTRARHQAIAAGRSLYRHLFGNGKGLRAYLAQLPPGEPCQVTLSIGREAYPLWRLPWETLHDGKGFLGLDGLFPISRRPADLRTLTPQPGASPLRVLAVIANPEDQVRYDAALVSGVLLESLDLLIGQGLAKLEILTEPTSAALLAAVREKVYHAIHFIGHGVYHLTESRGFLCLEDDVGKTELLSGAQLPRFLERWSPRLFLLSACPTAQVGASDAFTGVADELLHHEVPAVIAAAAHLEPAAAVAYYRALYSELAAGAPLIDSIQKGRLALQEIEDAAPRDYQTLTWAMPTLYLRAPDMRLIQAETALAAEESLRASPPTAFAGDHPAFGDAIGRKQELQTIRKALKEGDRIFYIWGHEGIGKRHLVSQLLARWQSRPSAVLRVNCRNVEEPVAVLGEIADFWRGASSDGDREAPRILLDLRLDPYERARTAMQQLADKRYMIVLDDIDAWFDDSGDSPHDTIADATVRSILLGLMSVPSRSVFLITGSRAWVDLAAANSENLRQIHIPLLPLEPTIRLMHQWPELRGLSGDQKELAHWHLGGHPKALQLLAGWMRYGGNLEALLADPPVSNRATQAWISYLATDILAHLDPGAFDVLRSLAILTKPFTAATMAKLTPVTSEHAAILVADWQRLGLIDDAKTDEPGLLSVQPEVRRIILARLSADETSALHRQAAAYYGAPLVDAARRQILARNITAWSQERVEWLASDTNGVLGIWLRQPPDDHRVTDVLGCALAWQHHLMLAGALSAASHIVQTITPELNRRGQRDLSRKLIQQTTETHEGFHVLPEANASVAPGLDTGDLTTTARAYERAYKALDPKKDRRQRAHLLVQLADVNRQLGRRQAVVQCLRTATETLRQERDTKGEAESLYRLARAYRELPDHKRALVSSQAARELFESLTLPHGLAAVEREQGLILRELGFPDQALERFASSLRLCRDLDDRSGVVANLMDIGLLLERLGKTEMAIQVIEEALDHCGYLHDPDHAEVLSLLERLYGRQQRLNEAMARYRTARRSAEAQS